MEYGYYEQSGSPFKGRTMEGLKAFVALYLFWRYALRYI